MITIKYTPVGQNPDELTLLPPLVPEVTEFSAKKGYMAILPDGYAKKLLAENHRIFIEVENVIPDVLTKDTLSGIDSIDELVELGKTRFNADLDITKGVTKLRAELLKLQDEKTKAESTI